MIAIAAISSASAPCRGRILVSVARSLPHRDRFAHQFAAIPVHSASQK
jgi:hypothetical protein